MALHETASAVLYPHKGERLFHHRRFTPAADLAPFVEHYWTVHWDLPRAQTHIQETIPYPCVHLAFEEGNSEIVCLLRGRFQRVLRGRRRVFAVKFRPGGFCPFINKPMNTLLDQRLPVSALFADLDTEQFERMLFAENDEPGMARRINTLLRTRQPRVSAELLLIRNIYEFICNNRDVHQVGQLTEHSGLSHRALQRLFAYHVGVPPKWVIRRVRLHDAMQRILNQPDCLIADIAQDLGYADQAHFSRDFKSVVGVSPRAYARGQ